MNRWPQRRMKYCVAINRRSLGEDTAENFEFRYVDITSVGRGVLVGEPQSMRFRDAPSRARRIVEPGDTIVSTVRTYLRAVWPVCEPCDDLVVSTGFAVLSPDHELEPRFLGWWAQSSPFVEEIVARSVGVSYPAINATDIGYLQMPLPPLNTQRAIADYLDAETARIDALIEKKRRMIVLLEERMAELTTIAVTRGIGPSARGSVGPPWLASMPTSWRPYPLGRLVRMISGGTPNRDTETYWAGEIPWASPKDMKRLHIADTEDHISSEAVTAAGLKVLPADSVLVVVRGMILAHSFPVALTTNPMTINQDMKGLLANAPLRPEFLTYLLVGMKTVMLSFVEEAAHGTRKLATEVWSKVPIGLPPVDEQDAIVRSLTASTTASMSISSRLTAQIERLTERRQALITAAVTGELAIPGVPA